MEKYQNIVIGFGKGGKTLAKALASKGESVLVVEKSSLCKIDSSFSIENQ